MYILRNPREPFTKSTVYLAAVLLEPQQRVVIHLVQFGPIQYSLTLNELASWLFIEVG